MIESTALKVTEQAISEALVKAATFRKTCFVICANAQAEDDHGNLPIHLLLSKKVRPSEVYTRKYLVEKILDVFPQCAGKKNKAGFYPVHLAAAVGIVSIIETIVRHSPECVQWYSDQGLLPLHNAAALCNRDAVDYLFEKYPAAIELPRRVASPNLPSSDIVGCIDSEEGSADCAKARRRSSDAGALLAEDFAKRKGHEDLASLLRERRIEFQNSKRKAESLSSPSSTDDVDESNKEHDVGMGNVNLNEYQAHFNFAMADADLEVVKASNQLSEARKDSHLEKARDGPTVSIVASEEADADARDKGPESSEDSSCSGKISSKTTADAAPFSAPANIQISPLDTKNWALDINELYSKVKRTVLALRSANDSVFTPKNKHRPRGEGKTPSSRLAPVPVPSRKLPTMEIMSPEEMSNNKQLHRILSESHSQSRLGDGANAATERGADSRDHDDDHTRRSHSRTGGGEAPQGRLTIAAAAAGAVDAVTSASRREAPSPAASSGTGPVRRYSFQTHDEFSPKTTASLSHTGLADGIEVFINEEGVKRRKKNIVNNFNPYASSGGMFRARPFFHVPHIEAEQERLNDLRAKEEERHRHLEEYINGIRLSNLYAEEVFQNDPILTVSHEDNIQTSCDSSDALVVTLSNSLKPFRSKSRSLDGTPITADELAPQTRVLGGDGSHSFATASTIPFDAAAAAKPESSSMPVGIRIDTATKTTTTTTTAAAQRVESERDSEVRAEIRAKVANFTPFSQNVLILNARSNSLVAARGSSIDASSSQRNADIKSSIAAVRSSMLSPTGAASAAQRGIVESYAICPSSEIRPSELADLDGIGDPCGESEDLLVDIGDASSAGSVKVSSIQKLASDHRNLQKHRRLSMGAVSGGNLGINIVLPMIVGQTETETGAESAAVVPVTATVSASGSGDGKVDCSQDPDQEEGEVAAVSRLLLKGTAKVRSVPSMHVSTKSSSASPRSSAVSPRQARSPTKRSPTAALKLLTTEPNETKTGETSLSDKTAPAPNQHSMLDKRYVLSRSNDDFSDQVLPGMEPLSSRRLDVVPLPERSTAAATAAIASGSPTAEISARHASSKRMNSLADSADLNDGDVDENRDGEGAGAGDDYPRASATASGIDVEATSGDTHSMNVVAAHPRSGSGTIMLQRAQTQQQPSLIYRLNSHSSDKENDGQARSPSVAPAAAAASTEGGIFSGSGSGAGCKKANVEEAANLFHLPPIVTSSPATADTASAAAAAAVHDSRGVRSGGSDTAVSSLVLALEGASRPNGGLASSHSKHPTVPDRGPHSDAPSSSSPTRIPALAPALAPTLSQTQVLFGVKVSSADAQCEDRSLSGSSSIFSQQEKKLQIELPKKHPIMRELDAFVSLKIPGQLPLSPSSRAVVAASTPTNANTVAQKGGYRSKRSSFEGVHQRRIKRNSLEEGSPDNHDNNVNDSGSSASVSGSASGSTSRAGGISILSAASVAANCVMSSIGIKSIIKDSDDLGSIASVDSGDEISVYGSVCAPRQGGAHAPKRGGRVYNFSPSKEQQMQQQQQQQHHHPLTLDEAKSLDASSSPSQALRKSDSPKQQSPVAVRDAVVAATKKTVFEMNSAAAKRDAKLTASSQARDQQVPTGENQLAEHKQKHQSKQHSAADKAAKVEREKSERDEEMTRKEEEETRAASAVNGEKKNDPSRTQQPRPPSQPKKSSMPTPVRNVTVAAVGPSSALAQRPAGTDSGSALAAGVAPSTSKPSKASNVSTVSNKNSNKNSNTSSNNGSNNNHSAGSVSKTGAGSAKKGGVKGAAGAAAGGTGAGSGTVKALAERKVPKGRGRG